jgi:hypothetical protein
MKAIERAIVRNNILILSRTPDIQREKAAGRPARTGSIPIMVPHKSASPSPIVRCCFKAIAKWTGHWSRKVTASGLRSFMPPGSPPGTVRSIPRWDG